MPDFTAGNMSLLVILLYLLQSDCQGLPMPFHWNGKHLVGTGVLNRGIVLLLPLVFQKLLLLFQQQQFVSLLATELANCIAIYMLLYQCICLSCLRYAPMAKLLLFVESLHFQVLGLRTAYHVCGGASLLRRRFLTL